MGQKVPRLFVMLCTILAMLFAGILCFSSLWEAIVEKVTSVKYVLDILSFPGAIVLLLCALKQPNCVESDTGNSNGNGGFYTPLRGDEVDFSGKDVDGSVTTPFAEAGILSTISFWWLNPLMKKGKEKILEDRDVPQLRRDDQAETCYFFFMEQLSRRKQKGSSDKLSILWVLFFSQWKALLISGFFALIKVLALATSPLLLNAFIKVAEGNESFRYEGYALAGGLFLVKCLESLSERQWYFRTRLIGLQVRSLLSAAIYQKQLRLSNDANMTHSHGEIINYVTVDAHRIGEFPYWFHQIWTTILQLCLALVIVYYCVGLATIAALVVLVITVFGNSPFAKLQHKYQKKLMAAQDRRLKAITEALTSMKVLKLYAWETHFRKIIDGFRIEEIKWVSAVQYLQGYNVVLFWSSSILISAATFGACYFLGISLYASNVFTFLVTLRIVQEPIRYSADVVGVFIQANVSFSRIVKFLEAPEVQNRHVRQKYNGKELSQSIVIRSTEISWAPNFLKPTLRNINLSVNHGEKVAICGEFGSGKSTLLAVVLGEVPYIDGTVQVYGKIAYVSQTAWIQTGTIQENIVFGSAMDQGRYQEVLQRCSLLKDLEMLPFGDLTEIGERGINLSGGQKQRVQLARALYQDADLYLLDDPFSAVDAHTATSLFNDYVMGALSGKTVLLVTHQVDFLPAFDSILLISEGEILIAGTYDQLMESSQELEDLVNAHDEITSSEKDGDKYSFPHQPKNYKGEMKKILIEEQPTSSSVDQLIKQEERETGDTGLKPYIMYLNQNKGMLHFSLSKLVYFAFMFGQLIQNYWLAANVEDSSVSKSTLITVYSIIGCSLILFLLLRSLFVVLLGLGASTSIFSKLMSSLFRAPMVFYDSTPVGRILSRVSSDLSTIDLVLPFKLTFTIGGIINAYFGLAVLAIFTWQISFLIILMVYLTILLQRYYFTTAKELMRINGTTKSSVVSHLAESIAGSITIRAFEAEDRFFSKNLELIDANARPFFHNFAATEWLVQRLEILCAVILSCSALAMTFFHHGTSASGFIGMALFYGLSLNIYMVYAVQNQCMLANYIVSLERLEQYMHIPSEAPEVIQGIRPALNWPTVGKVEICDLKVRYRPNAPLVLQGISCIFEGGQKIGIVGRTAW